MQVRSQQGFMLDTCILTIVDSIVAPQHRHGVIQLMVSLDGEAFSAGATLDELREGHVHLIAVNEPHAVHGHDGLQAVVLLPQQSSVSRKLTAEYLGDEAIAVLPEKVLEELPLAALRDAYQERWGVAEFRPVCDRFLAILGRAVPDAPTALHPAIRRAVRAIADLEQKLISADELSEMVGLSKGHFLRTFSRELGIPLRPYLQWLRLMDAFVVLTSGGSVTDAATHAGFTDSAHLHRVTRRAFAMNPTGLGRLRDTFHVDTESRRPSG